MSEFKFACPICGQHITADSKDTGSEISCPTCYRKIVVPQAPTMGDAKFVLSASEANKPRPTSTTPLPLAGIQRQPEKTSIPLIVVICLLFAGGVGAAVFALRGKIFHSKPPVEEAQDTDPMLAKPESPTQQPEYTGTNLWTLDLSSATYPDEPASGSIHHRAFTMEHATLTGSNLTLRVGHSGSIELGVNVYFFNRQPEELNGKTAEVKPDDTKAPRVVLRWKEADRTSETFRSGYAMKVEFGTVANGSMPGKIFLCLPDGAQSWVAGTFRAEIRKPSLPKPRTPAMPKTQ